MLVSPTLTNTSLSNREIYTRIKTERSYLVLPKDDTTALYFAETGPINVDFATNRVQPWEMEQFPVHNTKFKLVDKEKLKAASSVASSEWIIKNNIGIIPISEPSINLELK